MNLSGEQKFSSPFSRVIQARKALRIVVRATIFSERFDQRDLAEGILQTAANTHTKEVMEVVGALILDPSESGASSPENMLG